MTDSTSRSDTPAGGAPRPVVFDPAAPAALPAAPASAGAVLLLAADPERRWAAQAAVELATAWARDSRRVVLADLHLESPLLHEVAGTPNLEGVVDVFLYGASLSRSAHPVRGRNFYLISAGTYEPDAAAIYRHPRWTKLVSGFRDADATLLLFAPAESADLRALAPHVGRAVILGAPEPELLDRLSEAGIGASAVLVPPTVGWDDVVEMQPAPVPAAAAASTPEEKELQLPPAPVRPKRRSRRGLWILLGLLLLALALAGAGFWASRFRPDLLERAGLGGLVGRSAAPAATSAAVDAAPPAAVERAGQPLPYSVHVTSFQLLAPARQQLERQRTQFGDVPFFISLEVIDQVPYFRILAGALPDTVAARVLREQLVAAGAVEEEDAGGSWALIQNVPLAYDLGEFPTAERARASADSLAAREVPAYVLPMPFSDGSERWQLYGGAFPDSTTAEPMRALLVEAGLPARLVPRTGAAASAETPPQPGG